MKKKLQTKKVAVAGKRAFNSAENRKKGGVK